RHAATEDGGLTDGASFARLDPTCSPRRASMEHLLELVGLAGFGRLLGERLTPLIRRLAGDVRYERVYCYLYAAGDYVSVHDDHHVGDRVDVQFAVSLHSVGGLRVLEDGLLR